MFMLDSLSPLHRYCIAAYKSCNTAGHVWDQECITLYFINIYKMGQSFTGRHYPLSVSLHAAKDKGAG